MLKITLGVDGMMCGMCESHVNDAVRKAFPVKKVTSSHGKGQTVILTASASAPSCSSPTAIPPTTSRISPTVPSAATPAGAAARSAPA